MSDPAEAVVEAVAIELHRQTCACHDGPDEYIRIRARKLIKAGLRAATESDEIEVIPGTPENLSGLSRLLERWQCCSAPSLCGAVCQATELSDVLARAQRLVVAEQKASHAKPAT